MHKTYYRPPSHSREKTYTTEQDKFSRSQWYNPKLEYQKLGKGMVCSQSSAVGSWSLNCISLTTEISREEGINEQKSPLHPKEIKWRITDSYPLSEINTSHCLRLFGHVLRTSAHHLLFRPFLAFVWQGWRDRLDAVRPWCNSALCTDRQRLWCYFELDRLRWDWH